MKKLILFATILFYFHAAQAQQEQITDKEAITNVIKTFFDAYRAQDTSIMSALFHAEATMGSAIVDQNGNPQLRKGNVQNFLNFAGTKNGNYYDERIYSYDITIDGPLATAWTEYSFFLNDNFSHCGYNVFTLLKSADGWKIIYIIDTKRKTGCKTE